MKVHLELITSILVDVTDEEYKILDGYDQVAYDKLLDELTDRLDIDLVCRMTRLKAQT
jgi:hypothetical protein